MEIAVLFKVVPDDQDIQVKADRTLDFSKAKPKVSEYDLNAIEEAAQLAAANPGSKVVAITVGPKSIDDSKLKKNVLARGVDELVMVADDSLDGLDAYATAAALAKAVESAGCRSTCCWPATVPPTTMRSRCRCSWLASWACPWSPLPPRWTSTAALPPSSAPWRTPSRPCAWPCPPWSAVSSRHRAASHPRHEGHPGRRQEAGCYAPPSGLRCACATVEVVVLPGSRARRPQAGGARRRRLTARSDAVRRRPQGAYLC